MKILICGLNFAPELTGVGKFTGEMAVWLKNQGHDVRVVTAPPYYPEWRVAKGYSAWRYRKETVAGVQVYRCPLWVPRQASGFKRLLHLASFGLSCLPMMLLMARWKPQLVWMAQPTLFSAPAVLACAALCRAPAWLHVQDFEVDAAFGVGLLKGAWLRRFVLAVERSLLRRFDRVSTISERMVEGLVDKGLKRERVWLFPNWVDTGAITTEAKGRGLRQELGLAEGPVVCLYSGNMGKKQGLHVLIEVAHHLRHREDVVFALCGAGVARADLEAAAVGLPNVRFFKLQPSETLPDLLGMADIHLLPQLADAADLVMPSKLNGMLASGRPTIACALPGTQIAQVVEGRGIVVPPEQAGPLAAAIERLAGDVGLRAKLGGEARAYAEQHLSRDVVLNRFKVA